jgi:hypothetical protein
MWKKKEREAWEDLDVGGRIGLNWFRIGSSGGLL